MKEKEKLLKMKGVLLASFIGLNTLSGCGEKAECKIKEDHVHMYVDDHGFITYFNDEHLYVDNFTRNDDYVYISADEKDLYNYIENYSLIPIENNKDTINKIEENYQDYTEYRYRYTYMHYSVYHVGKSTYRRAVPVKAHSWTRDPNHSRLTGETRICHYKCRGVHIYKDEHGEYKKEYSDYVDSINDLDSRFTYIEKHFYKIINLSTNEEIDYEDGPEEEKIYIIDDDYDISKLDNKIIKKTLL